jgi:hypothetical protein
VIIVLLMNTRILAFAKRVRGSRRLETATCSIPAKGGGQMRVLFADDQIPSSIDAENEICKQELRKELSGKLPNFDSAYRADYEWFTELVRYLSVDKGFELTTARTFSAAMALAQKRDDYDVAVIDLSWTGDPGVVPGEKRNSGLRILRAIAQGNKTTGRYKPTIAFSQNYQKDHGLFAEVLEAGALPIPKDYTDTGQRSVGAAIELMGLRTDTGTPSATKRWDQVSIGEILKSLSIAQLWSVVLAAVGALAAVALFAFWVGQQIPSPNRGTPATPKSLAGPAPKGGIAQPVRAWNPNF